jgi:hypothetical protein
MGYHAPIHFIVSFALDQHVFERLLSSVVKPNLECLIIDLQFVTSIIELLFFEFLLVLFVSQADNSLLDEVNQFVTRLINKGDVVLRLQDSDVF